MDGENNGKPYEQMDDSGGKPTIFGNIHMENFWSINLSQQGTRDTQDMVANASTFSDPRFINDGVVRWVFLFVDLWGLS